MRVVREGEIKEWEVECPKCKSLLRYGHEDIRTNFFTGHENVKCPICGEIIGTELAKEVKVEKIEKPSYTPCDPPYLSVHKT